MSDIISELKFGPDGLIPTIAQDAATGEVLMVAWMNAESLRLTIETGEAHLLVAQPQEVLAQGRREWQRPEGQGNPDRLRQGRAASEDLPDRRRRLPHRLPFLLLLGPQGRRLGGTRRQGFQPGGEVREEVT